MDLFDAALEGPDEHLALDAIEAWVDGVDRDDWTAMEALLQRLRGDHG